MTLHRRIFSAVLIALSLTSLVIAQDFGRYDKERSRMMLKILKDDIKKYYYDPQFHGMDLDQRFSAAEQRLDKAQSLGQLFSVIAQVLVDLDDSHTFFIPPARTRKTEYGWQMQMIGDDCYIKAVKPGSDAEAKGLKAGDKILSVAGFEPNRDILWKMIYTFYTIRPQPVMSLEVQSPGGNPRKVDVNAKVTEGKQVIDLTYGSRDYLNIIRQGENEGRLQASRYTESGDDVFIWKFPDFEKSDFHIDDMMGKVRKHKALILDLRGNPGGYIEEMQRLTGYFFDHDVKIADEKGRKGTKPQIAKTHGDKTYNGKVIVLIDSETASAAELFARIMQLEKRGTVVGDVSAGAVMEAQIEEHQLGTDSVIPFYASITRADLIMTDGKSLEKVGVIPDNKLLPTGADLAMQRDPVLSRAAELAGIKLSPEKAGALFPIQGLK